MRRAAHLCSQTCGQVYLEIGFSTGEIARAIDQRGSTAGRWISGAYLGEGPVCNRLIGWISSRSAKGVVLAWPRRPQPESELALLRLCRACDRSGCPTVVILPAAAHSLNDPLVRTLGAAADSRTKLLSPCSLDRCGAHEDLRLFGLRTGLPPDTGAACCHLRSTSDRPSPYIHLRNDTAQWILEWLHLSCMRLAEAPSNAIISNGRPDARYGAAMGQSAALF